MGQGVGVTVPSGAAAATGAYRLGYTAGTESQPATPTQAIDVLVGKLATLTALLMLMAWMPVHEVLVVMIRVAHVQGRLVSLCF